MLQKPPVNHTSALASFGGQLEAVVVRANPPIFAEWDKHWARQPGMTPEKAAERVETTRREFGEVECPALRGLSQELEKARAPAIPAIGIMMDATRYEILAARSLSELRATYLGPGSKAPSQPNELLEAIEALRQGLDECSQQ